MARGDSQKYAVRRISLGSTLKYGFVLGVLLSLCPSLLCGLSGSWLVSTLHQLLVGWRDVRLEVLGQPIRFDLVDLLNLQEAVETLRALDQNDWLLALLLVVVTCCLAALALGLSANLLALGYNALAWLTGGLVVELDALDAPGAGRPARPQIVPAEHPRQLAAPDEPASPG